MLIQEHLDFGDEKIAIYRLCNDREDQWFERKSIRIEPRDLASVMIGFANADGGRIAIGISNGEIEGIDAEINKINELLQASINHCEPPVRYSHSFIECLNNAGDADHILLLDIEASDRVHRNRKGECYLRIGDETRKLDKVAETELAYDKHESIFDSSIAPGVSLDDLDAEGLQRYAERVGASSVPKLLISRYLSVDNLRRSGVTQAGNLLFGLNPPVWSYIRYLRYSGVKIETGQRSNLGEDIMIVGTLPDLIARAREILSEKLLVSRLMPSGRFERVLCLPEFAWLEAVVNAVTHRSYSLQGDGIRIRDFDDRLEVESPGRLPGLVRVQNIRSTRFSRNPHIARVLAEMTGYVRELNEGVQRMYEEMARVELPEPIFTIGEASVKLTLIKSQVITINQTAQDFNSNQATIDKVLELFGRIDKDRFLKTIQITKTLLPASINQLADAIGVSLPTARRYLLILESAGFVIRAAKSMNDPTAKWHATDLLKQLDISLLESY